MRNVMIDIMCHTIIKIEDTRTRNSLENKQSAMTKYAMLSFRSEEGCYY